MKLGKKANGRLILESWAEVAFVILILLGFFISLIIYSPFLNYLVIILSGFLAGRIFYEKKRTQPIFPYLLIMVGFLLGFMLGAVRASKLAVIVLFLGTALVSYKLHQKGHISFFRSEGFIK